MLLSGLIRVDVPDTKQRDGGLIVFIGRRFVGGAGGHLLGFDNDEKIYCHPRSKIFVFEIMT